VKNQKLSSLLPLPSFRLIAPLSLTLAINRRLLCQVYELVRAETDLPVLYAINTSHHGDHSYGNAFLPDEVQVVQHERTADFIGEFFGMVQKSVDTF
jgi:hypothetical protein